MCASSDIAGSVPSMAEENARLSARVAELEELLGRTEGLCATLDDGGDFADSLRSRGSWLLGLLLCQSASSFILQDNTALLQTHPTIVYFMTMLVGAGGNAGNQAAVRVIRGLATGEVNPLSERATLQAEVRIAAALSVVLVLAGFLRVAAFHASVADALAVSASLFFIVGTSVLLGASLPLLLNKLRVDAAHASTSIQVGASGPSPFLPRAQPMAPRATYQAHAPGPVPGSRAPRGRR